MSRIVKVGSGAKLRCKGWRQECILRSLENAVATGTKPEELITYAGNAKVARSWACYDDIVQALLDKGAKVNVKDNNGLTPLMAATGKKHFKIVELLMQAGATK